MGDKLEKILREYKVPKPSANLASRIIMAAEDIPQKQSLWKLIGRICEEFKLPDPVLSLASLLVLGFLVGFTAYSSSNAYAASGSNIEQLLSEDEELL